MLSYKLVDMEHAPEKSGLISLNPTNATLKGPGLDLLYFVRNDGISIYLVVRDNLMFRLAKNSQS